jgi:hypothetical protein
MGDSSVYFAKPLNAGPVGYDADGRQPGSIWRMQIPVGETRDILLIGPTGTGASLGVTSNNDNVVKNGDIRMRAAGGQQVISLRGNAIGTTLLDVGLIPFQGDARFPAGPPGRPVGGQYINVGLQVQVTRADGSLPGNDSGVRPEGQMDPTMCWAACLAWWLRALPDRAEISQSTLMVRGAKIWNSDGTMSLTNLRDFYERQNVRIRCDSVGSTAVNQYFVPSKLPFIIAFRTGVLGGHVNVIHAIDLTTSTVTAMEPWFPDPSSDLNYHFENEGFPVFLKNTDRSLFVFRGAHLKRPISYYTTKPFGQGFLICYPN